MSVLKHNKVGRHSMDKKDPKRKVPVSASLEQGLLWKLGELGISPTDLLTAAARAIETDETKKLEIKVEEKFKKWKDLEIQAGIAKAEYEGAKSELESRKKMELDLKLEEDCGAWYLRSLIEEGSIRKIEYTEPTKEKVVEIAEFLSENHGASIDYSNERPRILKDGDSFSLTHVRFLSNKGLTIDREGFIMPRPNAFGPSMEPSSLTRFKLELDIKRFSEDFLSGIVTEDSPLSVLKEYSPIITSSELKSEIKNRMVSFYRTVEVSE